MNTGPLKLKDSGKMHFPCLVDVVFSLAGVENITSTLPEDWMRASKDRRLNLTMVTSFKVSQLWPS
jgi:hypothetical protein